MTIGRYRKISQFLRGDGDEQTKVRHNGDFHTIITEKERVEITSEVRRRHVKFLQILVDNFGEDPFRRWDLDSGRLGYLINREVKYAGLGNPNPTSPNQFLKLDFDEIRASFPEVKIK